jgi:hypothetical protein
MDNYYSNLKEKRLNYREVLYKQMDDGQKLDKNLTGISAKEKELNKSILDKVTNDPLVMSRVMHRVFVWEIRGAKAIPPLVSIIGDVERVHGLDRHLLGQFLYLSWVLCACD